MKRSSVVTILALLLCISILCNAYQFFSPEKVISQKIMAFSAGFGTSEEVELSLTSKQWLAYLRFGVNMKIQDLDLPSVVAMKKVGNIIQEYGTPDLKAFLARSEKMEEKANHVPSSQTFQLWYTQEKYEDITETMDFIGYSNTAVNCKNYRHATLFFMNAKQEYYILEIPSTLGLKVITSQEGKSRWIYYTQNLRSYAVDGKTFDIYELSTIK